MVVKTVNYVNLRTGKEETSYLANGLAFNHLDGVQRGLVVIRNAKGEIERAYEVFSYFHRFDQTSSEIQFKREETKLDKEAIARRLKENLGVEVLVDMNEDKTVSCRSKENEETMRIEDFLLRFGAFSNTRGRKEK